MVAPFCDGRISRSMVRIPGSGTSEDSGLVCLNLGNVSSYAARVPVPQTLSFVSRNGRAVTSPVTSSLGSPGSTNKDDGKPTSLTNCDAIRDVFDTTSDSLPPEGSGTVERDSHEILRESFRASTTRRQPMVARTNEGVNGPNTRRKRPIRSESTEEPVVVSKRHRLESRPSVSSVPAVPTQVETSGFMIPKRTSGQPAFLPLASSSGSSTAVPTLTTTQANSGNAPVFVFPGMPGQQGMAYQAIPVQGVSYQHQRQLVQATAASQRIPKRDLKEYLERMFRERNQLRMENASLRHRLSCFQHLIQNKQKLDTVIKHLYGTPAVVKS